MCDDVIHSLHPDLCFSTLRSLVFLVMNENVRSFGREEKSRANTTQHTSESESWKLLFHRADVEEKKH